MGYVYSALLLTLIALYLYRRRTFAPAAWLKQIKPAAIVGISLIAILAIVFGVDVLRLSAFPTTGMASYRARNFGFFTGHRLDLLASGGRQLALLRRHRDRNVGSRDRLSDLGSDSSRPAPLGKSRNDVGFHRDAPRRDDIFVRAVASGVHISSLRQSTGVELLLLSSDRWRRRRAN